jgi:hypothetical protein
MATTNQPARVALFFSILLALTMISQACILNSESSETVLRDVPGTLTWGGLPAADGAGMLFETADTTYGAPGTRGDYSEYIPEGDYKVDIRADFWVTGETAVRGWGAEFPEIEFIKIRLTD